MFEAVQAGPAHSQRNLKNIGMDSTQHALPLCQSALAQRIITSCCLAIVLSHIMCTRMSKGGSCCQAAAFRAATCLQEPHDILGIDRGQIGEAPVLHARLGAEANDPDRQLLPEATPVVHEVEPAQLMPISQGTDTSNVSPGTGTSLKLRLNLHVQLSSAMALGRTQVSPKVAHMTMSTNYARTTCRLSYVGRLRGNRLFIMS